MQVSHTLNARHDDFEWETGEGGGYKFQIKSIVQLLRNGHVTRHL